MNAVIRFLLVAVYLAALASYVVPLPADATTIVRRIAALLLVVHVVELALAFRHVRRYRGPRTRVVDLHGRMLMSGLVDAHLHAVEGANEDLYACIDLCIDRAIRQITDWKDRIRDHKK